MNIKRIYLSISRREWASESLDNAFFLFMNFKNKYTLPDHLEDGKGLPRNNEEKLTLFICTYQDL